MGEIANPEALAFWYTFSSNRAINREFYALLSEDMYDFRMVDTSDRRSDSPRESLIHLIAVTRNYIQGVREGDLFFDTGKYVNKEEALSFSKEKLLAMYDESTQDLYRFLCSDEAVFGKVSVPWSDSAVPAISVLYGLSSHEILHTGWNLAIMDHVNMPRFEKLKQAWG